MICTEEDIVGEMLFKFSLLGFHFVGLLIISGDNLLIDIPEIALFDGFGLFIFGTKLFYHLYLLLVYFHSAKTSGLIYIYFIRIVFFSK